MATFDQLKLTPALDGANPNIGLADGSSTPVEFTLSPPAGTRWDTGPLQFFMSVNGDLNNQGFGDSQTPLTNGIEVFLRNKNTQATIVDFLGGVPWCCTMDVYKFLVNVVEVNLGEGVNTRHVISGVIDPSRIAPTNSLALREHEELVIRVNDDLTDSVLEIEEITFVGVALEVRLS